MTSLVSAACMARSAAKILFVEDNEEGRKEASALIERESECQVFAPESVKRLAEAITFELFDALLVDVDLNNFDDIGDRLNGQTIDDGKDVLTFYRTLHKRSSGRLYTSHAKLPGQFDEKIEDSSFPVEFLPKPLPRDIEQIRKLLNPIIQEANEFYRSNPLLQPLSYYHGRERSRSLRMYRKACRLHQNWFNFNLRNVGDRAWGVVCGRTAMRSFYGQTLNGNSHVSKEFMVETRGYYPSIDELKRVSAQTDAFAYLIWNTRNLEVVAGQFERFAEIPQFLQDYFGVAMIDSCLTAYKDGFEEQTFAWLGQLTPFAQKEVLKEIYKIHRHEPIVEQFRDRCRDAHLPVIIGVYQCRVDSIEHEINTAKVEIRELGTSRAIAMEPFDLEQLKENGIDHEHQLFEYLVYRDSYDDLGMSIDPLQSMT